MSRISSQDKFNFFVPATFEFEKGKDGKKRGLTKIKGVASTTTEDSDGEVLLCSGFDLHPLLNGGIVNYNHKSGVTSKAIVGEPTHAEISADGTKMLLEAVIYPNEEGLNIIEQAEVFEKYSPNRRFGFSIEGTATRRDPINPKRILEARIHGVAITPCPKNPNTIMNIVKGEYSEPLMDDEEEKDEDKIEKEMSTANTGMLAPESVEHSGKPRPGLKNLTKAQVYESIIDKYKSENLEYIKNIYNFVKSVNDKLMKGEQITQDSLDKAYNILDGIVKGEESTSITNSDEVKPEVVLEKSEGDAAFEFAKGMHAEGKTKDECVEGLIRKGYSLVVSQTAAEAAIAEANAKKEGGDIAPVSAPIVKAEDVAKLVLDDISKSLADTISKGIDPLNDKITKGFGAVNSLFKAQDEEAKLLKSEIGKLTDRLNKVENTPLPGRSIRNVGQLEKFAKSEDGSANLPEGFREISVSDHLEKSIILNELEHNFNTETNQVMKSFYGDAMMTIEAAGLAALNSETQKRLKLKLVA